MGIRVQYLKYGFDRKKKKSLQKIRALLDEILKKIDLVGGVGGLN